MNKESCPKCKYTKFYATDYMINLGIHYDVEFNTFILVKSRVWGKNLQYRYHVEFANCHRTLVEDVAHMILKNTIFMGEL